jgi:fluoride exporter
MTPQHPGDEPPGGRVGGRFAPLTIVVVLVGGAIGTLARERLGHLNPTSTAGFPVGTFIANVSGAFGLGLLIGALDRVRTSRLARPLIATGFFGAYTTFSTFAVEIVRRVKDHHVPMAVAYAVVTVLLGLVLATFGTAAGHRIRPTTTAAPS